MNDDPRGKKEYWDERAIEYKDDKDKMVWCSKHIHTHLRWFERMMDIYKNQDCLDIGCGYGRLAHYFEPKKYRGVDFSENLIKIAREDHPEYSFEVADAFEYEPQKQYGVIMAFHLSLMPEREEEFIKRYRQYAREAIIIVYGDRITVVHPKL